VKRKLPVKVTSTAEAEEAAYLACIPADGDTYYADNLFGYCCRCGTKVQFRPHAPVKPKRLCTKCGLEETVKAAQDPDGFIGATEETVNDVREYFRRESRRRHN